MYIIIWQKQKYHWNSLSISITVKDSRAQLFEAIRSFESMITPELRQQKLAEIHILGQNKFNAWQPNNISCEQKTKGGSRRKSKKISFVVGVLFCFCLCFCKSCCRIIFFCFTVFFVPYGVFFREWANVDVHYNSATVAFFGDGMKMMMNAVAVCQRRQRFHIVQHKMCIRLWFGKFSVWVPSLFRHLPNHSYGLFFGDSFFFSIFFFDHFQSAICSPHPKHQCYEIFVLAKEKHTFNWIFFLIQKWLLSNLGTLSFISFLSICYLIY